MPEQMVTIGGDTAGLLQSLLDLVDATQASLDSFDTLASGGDAALAQIQEGITAAWDAMSELVASGADVQELGVDLAGLGTEVNILKGEMDEAAGSSTTMGASFANAASSATAQSAAVDTVTSSTTQLADAADTASSSVDSLTASESAAADGAMGLGEAMGSLMDAISGAVDSALSLGGMFLEFEAIGGVIQAIQGFVGSMIGMNTEFQQLDTTLTDMVGANKAQQLISWIQQFGTKVPFTTEAISQATVALTGFGQNAQQVLPAVAAAAAAMSARGVTLDSATRAYVDALNGRWVMMQNQLGITKEQLEQYGLKLNDISGTLGPAMQQLVNAKYPNMLADQMGTFAGMLAEANDLVQLFAMHLGAPLFAEAQQGLGMVINWFQDPSTQASVGNFAAAIGTGLAKAFQFLGDVIAGAIVVFRTDLMPVFQGIGNLIQPLLGPLGNLGGSFAKLAAAVGGGLVGWLGGVAGGFKDMTGSGGPLQGIVQGIAGALQNAASWVNAFLQGLDQGKGPMGSLKGDLQNLKTFFDQVGTGIQTFLKWFQPVAPTFKQVGDVIVRIPGAASGFQQFLDGIGQRVQSIAQFLNPLIQNIKGFGSSVMSLIGPALGPLLMALQDTWAFLQSQFAPIWQQLVSTWNTSLKPAIDGLLSALQPLLPVFEGIGLLVGAFVVGELGLLIGVLDGIIGALSDVIQGVIQFVGGFIQFFSGLVQTVVGIITGFNQTLFDLLHGNWSKIGGDIQQAWGQITQGLQNIWTGMLTMGQGIFKTFFTSVIDLVKDFVGGIISYFTNLYNSLVGHSIIPDMVNAIIAWIGKLPGEVGTILGQLYDTFQTALKNLITSAFDWGADLIMGLINGIKNMLPALGQAAGAAAQIVGNLLGHSEPKEGPLKGDSQWGGHLVDNFIAGIKGKLPELDATIRQMAGSMVPSAGGLPIGAFGGGAGGLGGGSSTSQIVTLLQQLVGQGSRMPPPTGMPITAATGSIYNFSGLGGAMGLQLSPQDQQELALLLARITGQQIEGARLGAVYPF